MRFHRTPLFLLLCAVLAGALYFTLTPRVEAEEPADGEKSQLLLKCPPDQVTAVRKALRGLDVTIYDLKTMRRVPPYLEPKDIPPLPDAVRLMREILVTLEGVKAADGQALLHVTSMTIQERRAAVKMEATDRTAFDQASKALAANAHVKARKARIEHGAIQTMPDGRYRHTLSLKLSTDAAPGRPTGASATTVPMQAVQKAELAARMQAVYAGAVQDDPNRAKGYRRVSREFTYAEATLPQLKSLLADLATSDVFTVFEIRWKLADAKDQTGGAADRIMKPVVRIGSRPPITD